MEATAAQPAQDGLVKTPTIRCAFKTMVDPKTLKAHPKNPNVHPPKQLEIFVQILGYTGWRRPITVSNLSGFVTKGHGALEAALLAGYAEVPVDTQDYDDEAQELADIAADNQLARMSEMDPTKLKALMTELNTGAFNMELTGFENIKLEKLMGAGAPPTLKIEGQAGAPVEPGMAVAGGTLPGGSPAEGAGDPASQVRMVQLFLNEGNIAEFMTMCDALQIKLQTTNLTDTVFHGIKFAFGATAAADQAPVPTPEG